MICPICGTCMRQSQYDYFYCPKCGCKVPLVNDPHDYDKGK